MKNQLRSLRIPKSTFIGGWYASNKIVDSLIECYNTHNDKKKGVIWNTLSHKLEVDNNKKDSLDAAFYPEDWKQDTRLHPYIHFLNECIKAYEDKYTFVKSCDFYGLKFGFNIQKYKPGGGYKQWHFERNSSGNSSSRVLVFMTYLNDVKDGGTEFYHQNYKAPAKKGLTLIWPADWTHTHRSIISQTSEKMIATGWFNFFNVDYDL